MILESHINEGSQSSEQLRFKMKYGVSVTDVLVLVGKQQTRY